MKHERSTEIFFKCHQISFLEELWTQNSHINVHLHVQNTYKQHIQVRAWTKAFITGSLTMVFYNTTLHAQL